MNIYRPFLLSFLTACVLAGDTSAETSAPPPSSTAREEAAPGKSAQKHEESVDPLKITVTCQMCAEDQSLVLRPNTKGQLEVYLSSTGDPIDGHKVELFDVRNQKSISTVNTTEDGLLRFRRLTPGAYRLYLRKNPELANSTSVRIADIKLKEEGR